MDEARRLEAGAETTSGDRMRIACALGATTPSGESSIQTYFRESDAQTAGRSGPKRCSRSNPSCRARLSSRRSVQNRTGSPERFDCVSTSSVGMSESSRQDRTAMLPLRSTVTGWCRSSLPGSCGTARCRNRLSSVGMRTLAVALLISGTIESTSGMRNSYSSASHAVHGPTFSTTVSPARPIPTGSSPCSARCVSSERPRISTSSFHGKWKPD